MLTSKKLVSRKFLSLFVVLCMLVSLVPTGAFALENENLTDSDFMMEFKGSGDTTYLSTPGFDVFLCNTAFDRTFGDQKCSSMEMILQGQRIATDGDIRLSATPEQWDPVPTMIKHYADKENGWLIANESYADYDLTYNMKVTPEPGSFQVSVSLDNPLPDSLVGRAGFNLEFLPSIYKNKTYSVDDGKATGVLPTSAASQMSEQPKIIDDPIKRLNWQAQWDADRGDYQPAPLVTAQSNITLAPEDQSSRIKITSDNDQSLSLYDGRNKAQNGWFVLRSLIPSDKTADAVVWHIHPSVPQNWVRKPMVTYSQVGYIPNSTNKIAVIELDPKYSAPTEASLERLESDGTYTTVHKGNLSEPINYARYQYAKFDFSDIKEPGTYAINYDGIRTDVFPISENAYSNTWQASLSTYMAEQMDHMEVTEGYRVWHGAAHLDDARQAPANISWFDGWSMGSDLQSPYKPGEHIDGLNVGGWFDAGDFDIQTGSHLTIIQNLAVAAKAFNLSYDNLTVDENARTAEMHKPDGIPDAVQQVKHGALQILAQINSVGHTFNVIEVPTLKQYTHLGDASTDTDGLVYSSTLANEKGYSSTPDDRWAFTSSNLDTNAYVSLAAAAWALKSWDNDMYQKCLKAAVKIWKSQDHTSTTNNSDYSAAVFLMLATYDSKNPDAYAEYKDRITALAPTLGKSSGWMGISVDPIWQSTLIMPYMDDSFKATLKTAVETYKTSFDNQMASTPYGVPASNGMWGGSESVCNMGKYMYFLHKAFPDIVDGEYTLLAANYILGMHPYSSLSYVSGVGKNSKVHVYSNNRSDDTFIPGGVVPGYCIISPDFPECIDNFGMLWFESETNTTDASAWIIAGLGADAVAAEKSGKLTHTVNFKLTDSTSAAVEGAKIAIDGDSAAYQTSPIGETTINLEDGIYNYTITKDGFNTVSGTFEVSSKDIDVSETLTFNMSPTSVKVNGTELKGFDPSVHDYDMAANLNPVVTAQSYNGVRVSVTQATSVPGTATITLKRGDITEVYTINFREPPKLDSISVDGTPIPGFTSGNNEYFVQLPKGYSEFPTVTAEADAKYTVDVTQATAGSMKATVTVKDDHNIESSYSVNFGAITSIDFSKMKSTDDLENAGWSILNPNMSNFKFVDSGITVTSEAGDMYQDNNTAKNLLTCDNASGDWQADLTAAANKPFEENYQQGGITAYQDLDNFVKLDAEFNQSSLIWQFGSETSGSFNGSNAKFTMLKGSDGSYPIFYRLVKKGNTYSAYISNDGKNYVSCGTRTNNKITTAKLGLVALNNLDTAGPIEVTFKTLTITHPISSDKATLQNLYDTCQAITQDNYTNASWTAFTTTLKKAKLVLDSSSATQDEINASVTALTTSKNGLTKKSSDNTSNHHQSSTVLAQPSPADTFSSDTTVDVHVKASYIFKLTSKNGQIPTVVLGTPGVFEVQLASVNGSDYYMKLISVGKPQEKTGVYVNGLKIFVATVETPETPVSTIKCDTTRPFSLKSQTSYIFKLTSDAKPTFVAGSGSAFNVEFIRADGKDYFYKVTAIGKVGATSGFYINSEKAPITVITIS